VRSTDPRFLDLVRTYIGHFLLDVGADEDPLDWYLFSADCGYERPGVPARGKKRLYRGGLLMYSGLSMPEMAGRMFSGAADLVLTRGPFVRCRAGGVATEVGALLLPGPPDRHLPALVALLLRSGAGDFLGDEVVLIDPVLRKAHPSPLPLLVDTQDLVHLPELGREPPRVRRRDARRGRPPLASRQPVSPQELGARTANPMDVAWMVFPEFRPGELTELAPIGKAEAVFLLTESLLNAHIWGDRSLVLARDVVKDARTARLVVGDPVQAAEAMVTWLSSR
jgi:hypothetical protein